MCFARVALAYVHMRTCVSALRGVREFRCVWVYLRALARVCVRLSAVACVCVHVYAFESAHAW